MGLSLGEGGLGMWLVPAESVIEVPPLGMP
jgi:hypothetical protein